MFRTKAVTLRYYFHVRDKDRSILDEEGSELPGMTAARQEARTNALEFAMDDLRGGLRIGQRWIDISDAAGHRLDTLSLRDLVNARKA
jgi:uncharacterized protein DUF6894